MFGAIIGDIVGSRFEFDNIKTTEFELFGIGNEFTDDTVCTISFMDWLLNSKERTDQSACEYLHRWTNKYPSAGYGGRFKHWVFSNDPKPYGSFGNGAAMRISSVAWAAKDLEELESLSNMVTGITHNHPEGLKGALVVATCIFMAIHNATKEEIKEYAISMYPEIASLDYYELVRTFEFNETCQKTVPQAIYCFLISSSYEDCIRKTISIGGDCDTTSAMSGAIAEAYWGIPNYIIERAKDYLPYEMIHVIDQFYTKYIYQDKHPIKLERFRVAQEKDFDIALNELKNGQKQSHWMWYIFPQIKGLGKSNINEYYSLGGIKDAVAFYNDEILGHRLIKLCEILLGLPNDYYIEDIMGSPDDMKLKSSMTLFYLSTNDQIFKDVLNKYFGGELDSRTLKILNKQI